MMKKAIGTLVVLLLALHTFAADTTVVISPNGKMQFRLFTFNKGLGFSVRNGNVSVINASPLSMTINGKELLTNARPGKPYKSNERYDWLGVHSTSVNQCNGLQIPVQGCVLDIRAYNDGVAFRITTGEKQNAVPDEGTVFNIPGGSNIWYHDLEMHYEGIYSKKAISALQEGEWVAPPATFKLPNGSYASITEADLTGYSGMALQANGKGGLVIRLAHHQPTSYPYRLRYSAEDTFRLHQPVAYNGKIITPWRVVIIGNDLNAMVNNDIVHNLCPPPDTKFFPQGIYTAWLRPGRAVWKYLDGGGAGTVDVMMKFSKEASELGFEHNILEGFWSRWSDDSIRYLVDYSKKLGVDIWFWKHSKSLRDPLLRDSFFRRCHDLGVKGAKIDFFDHEAKEVIDLYDAILKEAAQYHLLLDFHGANKPTGRARTWPNELAREAVKGMEASKLTDRATHETTLPFTHFLAGPGEYTVVHLGERRQNTTWAHQIASAAILSAPLLTYGANPESLLANPAVDIIKHIPSTWDETIVLPGSEIGELAGFARRKNNTWFVAVMNGTQARKVRIPLTFLKQGKFNARTVSDDAGNSAAVVMGNAAYTAADVIELDLRAGGGFIAEIIRQ